MTRRRRVAVGAGAGAALAMMMLAPWGLRHVGFFQVRQLELEGLRHLAPGRVVEALALERDQNLFDPLGPVEARAEALAGVVSARIERRLPGTLRVTIVEQQAIAFAPGADGLVALDGAGRPLPYDPAATGLDLALVRRADPAVLGTLARIQAADSTLYQAIDAASRGRDGAVNVELGQRRLIVRAMPTSDEVRAVGAVRRHLTATGRPYLELDASYAGWVIARRGRS